MTPDTASNYAWNAVDYAANSAAQQQWAVELINKLGLQGKEHLLDIGCGDGKVTALLANHLATGRVLGIDSSPEMISLAEKSFSTMTPNLSFRLLDAVKLCFDQKFDVIFSNAALHWVLDHRPVLKGMYQALKPGGRVLVQMGGKGNAGQVIRAVEGVMKAEKWQQYFMDFIFPYGFYGPDEYGPWLEEAGFTIENIGLVPKEMIHGNREKFIGWLRTTWLPYLQRVPEQKRELFIEEVVSAYLEGRDAREPVITEMMRLEFLARRPA
jgi:trans-aconitate methyltransferase